MHNLKKLDAAVKAGSIVLKSGGEIYRVEQVIISIAKGLGLKNVDCFVLPTGITVSAIGDDDQMITRVMSNKEVGVDLEKISMVNALSRRASSESLTVDEVDEELDRVINKKPFSVRTNLLVSAIICASFAFMFDGGPRESVCAFFSGPIILLSKRGLRVLEVDSFFQNAVGSSIIVILSYIFSRLGLITLPDIYIASVVMLLVPGLLITNAFRDTFRGDYVSGVARISEVIVIGAGIGFGAALVYFIRSLF